MKELQKKVADGSTPEKSAVILVNGVADKLSELTHDPVAINVLATKLRESADELGKAICLSAPNTGPKVHKKR